MTPDSTNVDPRVAHTRLVVERATAELLAECGFEQITIEAIAERSGVARSTIYRNWPDRAELLTAGFAQLCSFSEIPDLGSIAAELQILGADLARGLTSEPWGKAVASLIGAAHHDPELVVAQQRFSAERRLITGAVFDRAIARGEISGDVDAGDLAEQFVAPFFFRRLMSHRPIDDAFIERQIEVLVSSVNPAEG